MCQGPLIYEVNDALQSGLCVNGELSNCQHRLLEVVLIYPIQDVIHLSIQFLCLLWLWILKLLLQVINWGTGEAVTDIKVKEGKEVRETIRGQYDITNNLIRRESLNTHVPTVYI